MDPVSNSVSYVSDVLHKLGACTREGALDVALTIVKGLSQSGEMVFAGQTDKGMEAKALALEQACGLAKTQHYQMDAALIVKMAATFTDFLLDKKPLRA